MDLFKNRLVSTIALSVCVASLPFVACAQDGLKSPSMNFTNVAKKAIPAVVSIQVTFGGQQSSSWDRQQDIDDPFGFFSEDLFKQFFGSPRGSRPQHEISGQASGFLVSQDGYILTNNHVVEKASKIRVRLNDEREFDAKVVGKDPNTDIALIKIDAKNLPYLKLGNSDNLEIGQWVAAVGNPLGLQASITVGVVSAKGRNNLDLVRIEDFIQTDAAINRGNSGGPLLNLDSEVVGINTAIVTSMVAGGYMGIGFAIPSNMARHVMDELMTNGSITRGYLGVALQKITEDLAGHFQLNKPEGALIAEVSKGSPADKGGLKPGDVILAYNKKPVVDFGALRNAIALMKPGTQMQLTVLREGTKKDVNVTIGTYPEDETKKTIDNANLGIEVENLSSDAARKLGYEQFQGVLINRVEQGSAAAWAGIKPGALIISVNRKEVNNVDDFNKSILEADTTKPILFLIRQGDVMQFIAIKVG